MLSCKETARLISEGADRSLPLHRRFALRLHLMMCDACTSYRRQIQALQDLFQRRFHNKPLTTPMQPEAKDKIMKIIRRESGA